MYTMYGPPRVTDDIVRRFHGGPYDRLEQRIPWNDPRHKTICLPVPTERRRLPRTRRPSWFYAAEPLWSAQELAWYQLAVYEGAEPGVDNYYYET